MSEAYRKMSNACLDSDDVDGVYGWGLSVWTSSAKEWNYVKREIKYLSTDPFSRGTVTVDTEEPDPEDKKETAKKLKGVGGAINANGVIFQVSWATAGQVPTLFWGSPPEDYEPLSDEEGKAQSIIAISSEIWEIFLAKDILPGTQVNFQGGSPPVSYKAVYTSEERKKSRVAIYKKKKKPSKK
jgi:hypothetical protein